MSTGDLYNNFEKLKSELRLVNLPATDIDLAGLKAGNPVAYLPLIHYILLDDSIHVARFLSERGYQMYHITDRQFLEATFRMIRKEFSYLPALSVDQFLSKGYAERKLIFLYDVIKLCRRKATELECLRNEMDRKPVVRAVGVRLQQQQQLGQLKGKGEIAKPPTPLVGGGKRINKGARSPNVSSKALLGHDRKDSPGTRQSAKQWRSRIDLTLQTTSLETSGGEGHNHSPTSSGPVSGPGSPVSITSAASAPAGPGYRTAPIRAKPEMLVGHTLIAPRNHPAQPSLENELSLGSMVNNRAMECWVTSPPQVLERSKKSNGSTKPENGLGAHWSLAHQTKSMSPRIRVQATALTGKAGIPRSSSANSLVELSSFGRKKSGGGGGGGGAAAGAGAATTTTESVQQKGGSSNNESDRARMIARKLSLSSAASVPFSERDMAFLTRGTENGGEPQNAAIAAQHPNEASAGTASGTTSVATTPRSSIGYNNCDDLSSESSDLADQVSKVVSAIDMLSNLPLKMAEMERKMMAALQTMDKRISYLDSQFKLAHEPGKGAAPGRKARNGPSSSASVPGGMGKGQKSRSSHGRHAHSGQQNLAPNHEGIDNFLRVIEERFKETETLLAQAEN